MVGYPERPTVALQGEPVVTNVLWDMYRNDTMTWEEFVTANAIGYLEDIINSGGEY